MKSEVLKEHYQYLIGLVILCLKLIWFFFKVVFGSNLQVIEIIIDLIDWGKINGSLEYLEMKNRLEKMKLPLERTGGAALEKPPQDMLCPTIPNTPHQTQTLRRAYLHQAVAVHSSKSAKDAWRPYYFPIFSYQFLCDVPTFSQLIPIHQIYPKIMKSSINMTS